MTNDYTKTLADIWFRHEVIVTEPAGRTAIGTTGTGRQHTVTASVDAQARTVTDTNGQETVAAATVRWSTDGPLPAPGWTITLPPAFGLRPGRRVIVARHCTTGTGLTPDFVEVIVQ